MPLTIADFFLRSAEILSEAQPIDIYGSCASRLSRCRDGRCGRALTDHLQLIVNQLFILPPDLFQILPQLLLYIERGAIERIRKLAMLLPVILAEILLQQRDAML